MKLKNQVAMSFEKRFGEPDAQAPSPLAAALASVIIDTVQMELRAQGYDVSESDLPKTEKITGGRR